MDWNDWLLGHEAAIRLGFFCSVFAAVAAWEIRSPRRKLSVSKAQRWLNNIGLVVLNTVLLLSLIHI